MNLKKKKGFTIVELVIVIAVIAILAAVLIPTFANLINKAHQSADIQAVRQMNLVLAKYTDGSIDTVADAVKVLDQDDIDLDNYKPLQKDHYFYFYVQNGTPKIVYMDKDSNVVFPKDAEITGIQLMSLSGAVPTDGNYVISDTGEVSIDSGAKLAHLIERVRGTKENPSTENLHITLSGNIDLRGAAVDFGSTKGNIIISGEDDAVLSGLRVDQNTISPTSGEFAGVKYGYGLLGQVQSGTVIIENITISGLNVSDTSKRSDDIRTLGLVAGYIDAGATVELNNVTFKDCMVSGYQKVGGIVGQLFGSLKMNNVKFENVSVRGALEVAKVVGISRREANLTVADCDFNGITTKLLSSDIGGTVKMQDIQYPLVGDSGNQYGYWEDYTAGSQHTRLFGLITNDLVWYLTDTLDNIQVNGDLYSLNGWVNSTSNNIVNGVPQA